MLGVDECRVCGKKITVGRKDAHEKQMEAIRNETDSKINALLNDDQKAKFAALQAERRQRMERRQNPGGDNSAPPSPGV